MQSSDPALEFAAPTPKQQPESSLILGDNATGQKVHQAFPILPHFPNATQQMVKIKDTSAPKTARKNLAFIRQ